MNEILADLERRIEERASRHAYGDGPNNGLGYVEERSYKAGALSLLPAIRVLVEALENYAAPRNCGSHYCDWHTHANNKVAQKALADFAKLLEAK